MSQDIYARVAAALARRGIAVTVEYPGYIAVTSPSGRGTWAVGRGNPTWGGDLTSADGAMLDATDFGIPSSSTDVELIADKIAALAKGLR